MKVKLVVSIIALIIVLILGGLLGYGYYQKQTYKIQRPIVTMEIEGYGTIKMELYPDMAPNTVKNFVKLINQGYYDGLTFHRVEKDMLIQGGDFAGTGAGENENTIKGEFTANGYKENTLIYERGTVGLARQDFASYAQYSTNDVNLTEEGYNSGFAQFFIMTAAMSSFNGNYTAFGKVTEGIEIVDELSRLETKTEVDETTKEETATSTPKDAPIIKKMTVETFGVDYGEPEVKEAFNINTFFQQYYGASF